MIEESGKKVVGWMWQNGLWPLLVALVLIPTLFEFVRAYYKSDFPSTVTHPAFFIPSIVAVLVAISTWCYLNRPKRLPSDRLVVAIANFKAVGKSTDEEGEATAHRIYEALLKKEEVPLSAKHIKHIVEGEGEEERKEAAIQLANSAPAHIIVFGDVRRDEGELYINPRIVIANNLGGAELEERKVQGKYITTAEPEYLKLKKRMASEVADLVTLVYGMALYKAKKWDKAIDVLSNAEDPEALFYKSLSHYYRAQKSANPIPDYREAIEGYKALSEVITRESSPQDWAATQNNLGATLRELASRSEGEEMAKLLNRSVKAYKLALTVYTRESSPQEWAITQNNLGTTLAQLALRSEGEERAKLLNRSVTAYELALTVYTRESSPQEWAGTQNNLGN
ncbi:Argininosuccinate lyase, partial [hydrothermal vent metagenome]